MLSCETAGGGGGGRNSVQCIEIVKKVVSVMMWNCGVTLLTTLKVAEGGLSRTDRELQKCYYKSSAAIWLHGGWLVGWLVGWRESFKYLIPSKYNCGHL